MPGPFVVKKQAKESDMCLSKSDTLTSQSDCHCPILPELPDDVSKHCLALAPRSHYRSIAAVCKRWRSFITSKEFITVRRLAGLLQEWLYVLTFNATEKVSHWEVLDSSGHKCYQLPPMPGPIKGDFCVVVLNGKLMVIGGYFSIDGTKAASADLYQYDSFLDSWEKLASMNVPRSNFACAEVNGVIYAVGGCGSDGEPVSSSEVYDPTTNKWTMIESLRRPRWGCFAYGVDGKLYVLGGRSNFTIGHSRYIDVYIPEAHTWHQMKKGCVMVTAHAVLAKKLYCMEWKNERKLTIFDPEVNSWEMVPIPVTGSSNVSFEFAVLNGKLLLFPSEYRPGYSTLLYDPNAPPGSEWQTSEIQLSGCCSYAVTIEA